MTKLTWEIEFNTVCADGCNDLEEDVLFDFNLVVEVLTKIQEKYETEVDGYEETNISIETFFDIFCDDDEVEKTKIQVGEYLKELKLEYSNNFRIAYCLSDEIYDYYESELDAQ